MDSASAMTTYGRWAEGFLDGTQRQGLVVSR